MREMVTVVLEMTMNRRVVLALVFFGNDSGGSYVSERHCENNNYE